MREPHQCTILAIDPGRTSGWALFVRGVCVASGVAKTHEERESFADLAIVTATARGVPLVVVGEIWTPGGKFGGARTMAGVGASWGQWLAAFEAAGIPKARVMRVKVQTWRAAVLGGAFGRTTEQWHAMAMRRAEHAIGRTPVDANEAEAVCIGIWATYAPEVARKIPKGRKKA